jgi:glc operon protein GlcG
MTQFWQQPTVTSEAALRLVHRAIDEGAARGVAVSVAVVDPTMTLVAFTKADHATPHSALTSRAKANTAASSRRATGWMTPELASGIAAATGGALTNITGGEPLVVAGQVIGAIGIAGGTPAQDAEIAAAAVADFADED